MTATNKMTSTIIKIVMHHPDLVSAKESCKGKGDVKERARCTFGVSYKFPQFPHGTVELGVCTVNVPFHIVEHSVSHVNTALCRALMDT